METNQNTAVHPSRAAKLCSNCLHQKSLGDGRYCNHPSQPISVVSGQPITRCRDARLESTCGNDAILFAVPLPRKERIKVKVGDTYEWRDAIQEPDATSINQENLPKALAV